MIRLLEQSHKIEAATPELVCTVERAGRTCYKSEYKIKPDSAHRFIQKLIRMGHESVLEHGAITVRFLTDRAVSHELVRHRLASYSQESQRYVDSKYKRLMEFIRPWWMPKEYVGDYDRGYINSSGNFERAEARIFLINLFHVYNQYQLLRNFGCTPQQARAVLPNATKTEIVVTANPREWRHIFKLRTSNAAYPQIRELMIPTLWTFKELWPAFFEDIRVKEEDE
jgi:thymidylate synthase (FAD)